MKKIIKLILLFICIPFAGTAQTSIEDVLQEIELNNTVLSTLRKQADAEKVGNQTGIYPENPEVEMHYLWGNNTPGNRTDFSASQSFDFPTAYYYKRKIADKKNMKLDLKYEIERNEILLEARQKCIELTYINAYMVEMRKRVSHAKQIADAYQLKFDKGEANILDLNKVKLNLLNARKGLNKHQTEKELLINELTRMNGGNVLTFESTTYKPELLPTDFEQWYVGMKEKNIGLHYLQEETAISKNSEKLQRSMNLPKFSVGYMSEKVLNEQFQGVIVGISIPLWENKNTVRQIKAQTIANQAAQNDADIRNYNLYQSMYNKAAKLLEIITEYATDMAGVDNSDLLKKALDAGEISLIDYILELEIYYEAIDNILETERDYQLVISEMKQWEL